MNLAVVETLQKKGPIPDIELLSELKDSYGDLSFRELNRVLLKLEVTGIIRVSRLMKGKRRVELVEHRERAA
jgi:Fe2+ or Zn2+ uptake regulation protein